MMGFVNENTSVTHFECVGERFDEWPAEHTLLRPTALNFREFR